MKSFLSDRARVEAPSVMGPDQATGFSAAGLASHGKGQAGHAGASTQIECIRDGDRITRMIVVCSCGERIEIDCLYAQGK